MAPKTTHLTIVFADISGSTRLYEVLGDAPARAQVASCLQILTDVTQRHGGSVIKTIGDELMCTFPTAESAVSAACEMHEMLEDEVVEAPATSDTGEKLKGEIDDLLDEIDEVLESNAEDFVRSYVQKGGQ